MDLCGINNLRWDLNPRYRKSPPVSGKRESGQLQLNGPQQEIQTQTAPLNSLTSLEVLMRLEIKTDGSEHRLQNKSRKSPSTLASPLLEVK